MARPRTPVPHSGIITYGIYADWMLDGIWQADQTSQSHAPYHKMRTNLCQSIYRTDAWSPPGHAALTLSSQHCWHADVCINGAEASQSHVHSGITHAQ